MLALFALVSHIVGDYILQKKLKKILPSKRSSFVGMLIHSAIADGIAFALLSPQAPLLGIVVGTALHCVVDSVLSFDKSLRFKALDQALHILCGVVFVLVI